MERYNASKSIRANFKIYDNWNSGKQKLRDFGEKITWNQEMILELLKGIKK